MEANVRALVSVGRYEEAFSLYASLANPAASAFPSLLKASAQLHSVPPARQIHAHIIKANLLSDRYVATALVSTYCSFRLLGEAGKVFDEIPNPTLPSYNAVISGFAQTGNFKESFASFKRLGREGLQPNSVTVASMLPACRTVEQGRQLHGLAVRKGLEADVYVATAVMTMYSNCSELSAARRVFALIEAKKIESYNAMISGCLKNGYFDVALDVFKEMTACCSESRPNSSTMLSLLLVCSELSDLLLGKEIHCYLLKCNLSYDVMIGTTLINMYCKCDLLHWAFRVFKKMDSRNLASWNSMISGVISHGHLETALHSFHRLKAEGFVPDSITWNIMISGFSRQGKVVEAFKFFNQMQLEGLSYSCLRLLTSLLQACSSISDVRHGKEIHGHVTRIGGANEDEIFQTALIDMYMKCGCVPHAGRIFDLMERKFCDPALWNAMISGYGRNGKNAWALEIFSRMQEIRVEPNSTTFLSVLSACSHTGQVEKGLEIFRMMIREYNINPTDEHFSSIIDLLGRSGKLVEAWDLIQEIHKPSVSMYLPLLGACGWHTDARLGELTIEGLSKFEQQHPIPLVVLSNIYAGQERWNDVENLRQKLIDRGLFKSPGHSRIAVA